MTPIDLDVHCRCGALRGKALGISPDTGSRLLCYCRDCQAFARFLGTPGILDAQGGSDAFTVSQSQLRIDAGRDKLACVRLSETGLMRFYASCCRTPIGNTLARSRSPFFAIVQPFMDSGEGRTREQVAGPVQMYVGTSAATGPVQRDPRTPSPVYAVTRLLGTLAKRLLLGKHKPSAFFGPDGKPVVTPEILTPERHEALRAGTAAE